MAIAYFNKYLEYPMKIAYNLHKIVIILLSLIIEIDFILVFA